MWRYANPNPCRAEEPDCVVRAIAIATGKTWDEVHCELCRLSGKLCSMPSVNWVWGYYLEKLGYRKRMAEPMTTVREFGRKHPEGTYVAATGSHAVCIRDGDHYDTWDSGDEVICCYWEKEKE